jgi:hypothetical protein
VNIVGRIASRWYRTDQGGFKIQVIDDGNLIHLKFADQYTFSMGKKQFLDFSEMIAFADKVVLNEIELPER